MTALISGQTLLRLFLDMLSNLSIKYYEYEKNIDLYRDIILNIFSEREKKIKL